MTIQRFNQSHSQSRFLDSLYSDISTLVNQYDNFPNYTKEQFKRDLFRVVAERVKQSFWNGITAGQTRANQTRRKKQFKQL